ncbi:MULTISPECIES: aromatic ring-hydroxylating oxygenase subunit alpha [Comamonas]|jgi:phenylpropionate dioxygenase-like ring-hydroxylating dioxygenase large terminal subunit|uniref:Aromatic ring-hydroxylating dioxygenase subunit alpha n=1 Tax=Comamonas terrigena TaxID=32013 RepID=A0A2A7UTN3_COMTR|nr:MULTISPECIES: aromatic ring-hydroxylating dioxygenase subunit alpha [Comamonas]MBD9532464.1 aromatic ring-hydroxylating dioxygenase subunit alpha [Comamonas sp. CMM01]MBV7418274.1 aromatic ring-hydroxylating dioxygenase subunit alpha [Comamonas sp. CMM03]PEH88638.1 aromatic ring-hydroxylating dioxygenase subunit alpha [Comamonas terrigena]SUY88273.1 Benzene 1,2-dioxygenase subunit alpha [Comamonas terrigena]BBL23658.1 (2Fe-2S)-binding protein [Comamonas terrigena NBRC 13299]
MSDLSLQLQQAASQLPVSSYFDEALFQREMATIFQRGPRYVGHAISVPHVGDYYALPQENEGRALVRNANGKVELVSNICRHRQAIMLKGRGNLLEEGKGHAGGNIVCPLHRWTYSPGGELLGAPHFSHDPCLNLNNYPLQEWNGLLFEANGRDVHADLAGMQLKEQLSFEGFVLSHVEMHTCNYNWKTFIEVYLEDYHVGPFHPGLGNFVTCDDLTWEFAKEYSVQTVGVAPSFGNPGSDVYKKWHEVLLQYRNGQLPERGAIWLTYYPHIMVEWYPHVLTVSTLHPISPTQTMNVVEFYYPEEIAAFEPEFVEAQKAAYMETAIEDDEIGERMDAGRRALLARGDNEVGPYQSPMEDGMQHFHEWYRSTMGEHVPRS